MPELAEVEFYRKQWNAGLRQRVLSVAIHPRVRIFRMANTRLLRQQLPGSTLLSSAASGKQILIRFSKDLWLGIHLGMTGKMRLEPAGFRPDKHDHFVLFQRQHTLVFSDPRQFGLIQWHQGDPPGWWVDRGPDILGRSFNRQLLKSILQRHARLPIKAALLLQRNFPGVGNWMADEILWRARIHPGIPAASVQEVELLWNSSRFVCRRALATVGRDFKDPPRGWLFHQRWSRRGTCPRHHTLLQFGTIGGRTTAWCPQCQSDAPLTLKRRPKGPQFLSPAQRAGYAVRKSPRPEGPR